MENEPHIISSFSPNNFFSIVYIMLLNIWYFMNKLVVEDCEMSYAVWLEKHDFVGERPKCKMASLYK